MKKLIFQLSFILGLATSLVAQNCNEYRCMIDRVERAIARKEFKTAFKDLESAAGYSDSKADEVARFRKLLFDAIEKEKQDANIARDDAKLERERADQKAEDAQRQEDTIKAQILLVEKIIVLYI